MALATRRLVRFGPFLLDAERRVLSRESERVPLRPRVFDTLLVLLSRSGQVVGKEDLLDAVWPDTVVEENNLNQNILALRRVFEDGGRNEVRIETVPRRGYRLIAHVEDEEELRTPEVRVETAPPIAPVPVPIVVTAGLTPVPPLPPTSVSPPAPATRGHGRRRAILAAGFAAAGLLTGWIWKVAHVPSPILGVQSLAVLPLRTLGTTAADDYLGLGIADAVITRLGYVRRLSVRPTASVRALGEAAGDPVAAGRQLQVDAVLDGQIQRSDGRIRVTVQLVGVRDAATLWSDKFDVRVSDLFSIEDSISESVARALSSSLSAGEARRVGRDRPTRPEAYDAYLKGRYFWNQRSRSATLKSRELFERAIALDPSYAPAYAGLADSLNSLPAFERALSPPREMARKALDLDDSLAEAHTSLGNTSLFTDWNFAEAESHFRRALDLNPSYATAHQWYAYCFLVRGDLAGATRESRRAREIDPLSRAIGVDEGLMAYYAGHSDTAVEKFRRVLELDPGFLQARQCLYGVLVARGDWEAAARECPPDSGELADFGKACEAMVAAGTGQTSRARELAESIDDPEAWPIKAVVALELSDRKRALAAIEDGYRMRSASFLVVGAEPLFDSLRSEPRFRELVEKAGIRRVERAAR